MQATAHILREEGAEGLSTNKVAKRAGVSIGSLYQYFPNKNSLILALATQHSDDQVREVAENIGLLFGASIHEAARRFVEATVSVHRQDPRLHLAITSEILVRGLGRALQDHARARELIAAWLRTRDDVDVDDPDMTAWMLVTAVESAVHMALFEDPDKLDDPAFTDAIVQMVVRTLGAR
ncbi:MAG: TetR/AcrR family transcriptional regulator [Myxococcota bacterium]